MGLVRTSYHKHIFTDHDRYGKDDQLGFLNRLTDDIVVDAAKEIKTGVRYLHRIAH